MHHTDTKSGAQGRASTNTIILDNGERAVRRDRERCSRPSLSAPEEIIAKCETYTIRQAAEEYRKRAGKLPDNYHEGLEAEAAYALFGMRAVMLVWEDASAFAAFEMDGPNDAEIVAAYYACWAGTDLEVLR